MNKVLWGIALGILSLCPIALLVVVIGREHLSRDVVLIICYCMISIAILFAIMVILLMLDEGSSEDDDIKTLCTKMADRVKSACNNLRPARISIFEKKVMPLMEA
jgi:hypothetical protein